jgi:hypothetical protein
MSYNKENGMTNTYKFSLRGEDSVLLYLTSIWIAYVALYFVYYWDILYYQEYLYIYFY